jgi:hypothetical protein
MPRLIEIVAYSVATLGDIIALSGEGIVSDPIKEFEKIAHEVEESSFIASHIALRAQRQIFEAVYPRVSLRPADEYAKLPTMVFRPLLPDNVKERCMMSIQAQWQGKAYDIPGVVAGMGLLEIERGLGLNIDANLFAGLHSRWCSELGDDYLRLLGIAPSGADSTIDPQAIVNFLTALSK